MLYSDLARYRRTSAHTACFTLLILTSITLLSACTITRVSDPVTLQAPASEIAEQALLNIDIGIFTPLQENFADQQAINLENLREAESVYASWMLGNTLRASQHWGLVRINPNELTGAEVIIQGEILQADGQTMRLAVRAYDAAGRLWLDTVYIQVLDDDYYGFSRRSTEDPFQDLYKQIANDISAVKNTLTLNEILAIRQIARLQFASRFTPQLANTYLSNTEKGLIELTRLPAIDDENYRKVIAIQARNDVYLELLQSQYSVLMTNIEQAYYDFRRRSHLLTLRLNGEILAGPEYDISAQINPDGVLASRGVSAENKETAASALLANRRQRSNNLNRGEKAALYSRILALMGQAIEVELESTIVEFEDRQFELTGTVEEQYQQWQAILDEFYRLDAGIL